MAPYQFNGFLPSSPYFRPTTLTITIRYFDNIGWEEDADFTEVDLSTNFWIEMLLGPSSLRTVTIERETRAGRENILDFYAKETMPRWRFHLDDGSSLRTNGQLTTNTWTGSAKFLRQPAQSQYPHGGNVPQHPGNLPHLTSSDTIKYYTIGMTWRAEQL
jgi:hypothetical protein